jgi:WD40 repeat protein
MESTSTLSKPVTSSMLSYSALTDTGYVLLLPAASRVSLIVECQLTVKCMTDNVHSPLSHLVFDLESKSIVEELKPEFVGVGKNSADPECLSLAWSADGSTLFAGYSDNKVRIFTVG